MEREEGKGPVFEAGFFAAAIFNQKRTYPKEKTGKLRIFFTSFFAKR
jgi:hypothetical protein